MALSSVQVSSRSGEVAGQAQDAALKPDDGKHFVDEHVIHTDVVIKDVNDPLAVQVPEGVGASTAGHQSPMGEVFARGTVEEQLNPDTSEAQVDPEDTATDTKAPDVAGTAPAADDKKDAAKS